MVVESAFSLMDGKYEILKPDHYIGQYPFQLGLTVIFQCLFTIFETRDYRLIQYCNVICVPIIIYAGYHILKMLGGKIKARIVYCVLAMLCFPLLFYTPFVYGEIFSIMAGTLFIWGIMAYVYLEKTVLIIPCIVCAVLGVMTRGSFWVVIIGAFIILGLYGVKRKNIVMLFLAMLIIVAPLFTDKAIKSCYEKQSGILLDQGIPLISDIAMGIHDEGYQPSGWCNLHNYYAYAGNGFNKEAAEEFSREYMRGRIAEFRDGSADWKAYFKEKLLTQWEEPTWQSLQANHDFVKKPDGFIYSIYYGEWRTGLLKFLDEYHLLIFTGSCLFFGHCWYRKTPFYTLLLEIIMIGGVLFSLIWEAKTRHSFPYMVYMLPCATIGLTEVSDTILNKLLRNIKKRC